MSKLKFNKYLFYFPVLIVIIFLSTSCRKEYVDYPYNDIEQFTITDELGNQLKAAISGDSIKVYWPPFQTKPDSIMPVITLSEKANISPASGVQVSFTEDTKYTVTAQNGTTRTFILSPMINQPAPVFEVQNTDLLAMGSTMRLTGQYFLPDTNQTKLFLIDANKKEVLLSINEDTFSSILIDAQIPMDGSIDTGFYQVKLVSGLNTKIQGSYHIAPPAVSELPVTYTFNEEGKSLKKGSEISFAYSMPPIGLKYYGGKYSKAEIKILLPGNASVGFYDATISSQTDTMLKFRLPSDISEGQILEMTLFAEDGATVYYMYTWFPEGTLITSIVP